MSARALTAAVIANIIATLVIVVYIEPWLRKRD